MGFIKCRKGGELYRRNLNVKGRRSGILRKERIQKEMDKLAARLDRSIDANIVN